MMVHNYDLHNILDWPSLQMGSSSDAKILKTSLAVDFSYQQNSFSVEDILEDGKVDSKKVSKWWLPN